MKDDRDQAGAAQAFDFCYELCCENDETLFYKLGDKNPSSLKPSTDAAGSPKDTFRKAAIEKLIETLEVWFEFQKKRN